MPAILTPKNTIEEVLQSHPEAQQVLASVDLPNCGGCLVRFDETLAEAADNYEFDLQRVLNRLNVGLIRHRMSVEGSVEPTMSWHQQRQSHRLALLKGAL
jgi:iron-sulfur cluster repair protein YtfE (RIC family)